MADYVTDVVFRTVKSGKFSGTVEVIQANIKGCGFTTYDTGDTYSNEWYLNRTRPSTKEEIAKRLPKLTNESFGGDTYSVRPVNRRSFN